MKKLILLISMLFVLISCTSSKENIRGYHKHKGYDGKHMNEEQKYSGCHSGNHDYRGHRGRHF